MVTTAPVISAHSFSKLAGKGGAKPLFLTYPHIEKSRGDKSGDHGGQAIIPPLSAPLYVSAMTGRTSKKLCATGMPSGGWK
jgi:hypothetical protein